MANTRALRLQFLHWLEERPRSYTMVMEAWRTSCPGQSVWEDACIDGLVERLADSQQVVVTAKGRAYVALSAQTQ